MIKCDYDVTSQQRDFTPSFSNTLITRGVMSGSDSLTLHITLEYCSESDMDFRNKLADLLESVGGVSDELISTLRSSFGCYEQWNAFFDK